MDMRLIAICSLFLTFGVTSYSQERSLWSTDDAGWVLRKKPKEDAYERFFALGIWNVPGYTANAMEDNPIKYRADALRYLTQSNLYNIVYLPPGKEHDSKGRVEVTGSVGFYEMLKSYQSSLPVDLSLADKDYAIRQYMRKHARDKSFIDAIDTTIDTILESGDCIDHIWAPIDEIVNGGAGSGWCWHPEIGEVIRERIQTKQKGALLYTDLVGISRGNSYLFEYNYLKNNREMPAEPPYQMLGDSAIVLQERPLLGFVQGYSGGPVYVNGSTSYVDYDIENLKRLFYENLRISAQAYRNCGDVFGINSFIDCNRNPLLVGIAVDAIKAGISKSTPVWIFLDGNGYSIPTGMTTSEFVCNLKCQVYTAIAHGATGILFWNDRTKSDEVFNELATVVEELNAYLADIMLDTYIQKSVDNLHYIIKRKNEKEGVLFATNSSGEDEVVLYLSDDVQYKLDPYEVIVVPIDISTVIL